MEMFLTAFSEMLNVSTIAFMLLGTVVGIVFGALPGMSATLAVAIFIPLTYKMDVVVGIPLLISLYIGGVSGGLISAILINIPGTPSSVATCFDGCPMYRKGQGGKALGVGIIYSFIGTVFSVIVLIFISPLLASLALNFGPYEYFSLTACSLLLVSGLAGRSLVKGVISALFGLFFSMVGLSPIDSVPRFTLGINALKAGLSMLPVLVGLFALPELLRYVRKQTVIEVADTPKIKGFGFSLQEFKDQLGNFFRSALIGLGIGILPGIGSATSNLLAYAAARNSSKYPEKFGTGIIDGIVASETANNSALGGAMIPLLSLGIPGDSVTALLLGALMLKGLSPGPMFFRNNQDVVHVIFLAMILASIMMVVIEFFGIRIFVRALKMPSRILLPVVVMICMVGAFTATNTVFSMWVLFFFGIVGFVFSELDVPLSPLIIGFVLGPICELYLRRGLQLSRGSFIPFITSPISGSVLLVGALFVAWKIWKSIKKYRSANA